MPDHTEREREAREVVMRGIVDTLRTLGHPATLESLDSVALDAYRAAVRAAVLAEVREKVKAHHLSMAYASADLIATLTTQLEATDATGA